MLGASALFNPHILLRSGFSHPLIGRRLHEQMPVYATIDLKGVKCYNGSTVLSGLGYLFYEGDHRAEHGVRLCRSPPRHTRQRLKISGEVKQ